MWFQTLFTHHFATSPLLQVSNSDWLRSRATKLAKLSVPTWLLCFSWQFMAVHPNLKPNLNQQNYEQTMATLGMCSQNYLYTRGKTHIKLQRSGWSPLLFRTWPSSFKVQIALRRKSTKLLKFKSIAYIQNDTYSVATVLSSVYITYTCIHIYIHSMCIYVYVYVYVHYILYRKHCTMITYTYLLQVLPRPTLFLRRVNLVELASGETGQRPRRSMFTPEIQPLVA